MSQFSPPACPVPHEGADRILLAHGEGGRLMRRLIRDVFLPALDHPQLRARADGACLPPVEGTPVVSTDSFVVSPLFFPGGSIGSLAVYGTVNDLAVCGAEPLYISVAWIVEEGLPVAVLSRIVEDLARAARTCAVSVVTADTKVVPNGAADQVFLTTTGIGRLRPGIQWDVQRVCVGDRIVVSGPIGDHGIAVLAARGTLGLELDLASDSAPLHELIGATLAHSPGVHFVRDPTRGGVAAVLHEVAEAAQVTLEIEEAAVPVRDPVRSACEILGLDPLYVACEGRLVAFVSPESASSIVRLLQSHPLGQRAASIGQVTGRGLAEVHVRSPLGALRVLDEPAGAPLPRIC
ncbi:MAG: hydrogenase expression/formation protein HypE [Gemmataceae bacterium]